MGWSRTQVLGGPGHFVPEVPGRTQWPIRVAEHLARQKYHVCLAAADNCVGLRSVGDQPDGASRNRGVALDPLGKRHLVTRPYWYLCLRRVPSGRAVHEIDAD